MPEPGVSQTIGKGNFCLSTHEVYVRNIYFIVYTKIKVDLILQDSFIYIYNAILRFTWFFIAKSVCDETVGDKKKVKRDPESAQKVI